MHRLIPLFLATAVLLTACGGSDATTESESAGTEVGDVDELLTE